MDVWGCCGCSAEGTGSSWVDGDVFAVYGFEDGAGVVGCFGERGISEDGAYSQKLQIGVLCS